jgi:hypothetical protein
VRPRKRISVMKVTVGFLLDKDNGLSIEQSRDRAQPHNGETQCSLASFRR